MSNDERKVISESIRDILADTDSDILIKKSLTLINPSKRRYIFLAISLLVISFLYLFLFSASVNVINSTIFLIESVNIIIIPTLGLAVTGYAIFQALANGDTLITLLKISKNDLSKFKEFNLFFLGFSILYLFIIIFNFLLLVFLKNVNSDWQLPYFNTEVNTIIYTVLISLYVTFILNALVEIKCFVYNLYQIFSMNASSNGINHLSADKDE